MATSKQRRPIRFIKSDTGCYICTSHKTSKNHRYPAIKFGKKSIRISRYLYELKFGKIPDKMYVCHTCDNPLCINIKHLFVGTQNENIQDMIKKGRNKNIECTGEKNAKAVITEKDVIEIRKLQYYRGLYAHLGRIYGITGDQVSRIYKGIHWSHI